MTLKLECQSIGDVVVIRCHGRIGAGAEVDALLHEVDKQTKIPGTNFLEVKRVVLQLEDTESIDSSGLGALVHLCTGLRAAGGELKLCEVSPTVLRILQMTNLQNLFRTYDSEKEAVDAFANEPRPRNATVGSTGAKIVCVDPSKDVLAYVQAVMKRAGYEVFATLRLGEAVSLVNATKPRAVICGPGVLAMPTGADAVEKFRRSGPDIQILHLSPDFSTADAGHAGAELVSRVEAMLAT